MCYLRSLLSRYLGAEAPEFNVRWLSKDRLDKDDFYDAEDEQAVEELKILEEQVWKQKQRRVCGIHPLITKKAISLQIKQQFEDRLERLQREIDAAQAVITDKSGQLERALVSLENQQQIANSFRDQVWKLLPFTYTW